MRRTNHTPGGERHLTYNNCNLKNLSDPATVPVTLDKIVPCAFTLPFKTGVQ